MRRTSLFVISTFLFVLCAGKAWSADTGITKHSIKSSIYGVDRNFFVKLPTTYKEGSKHTYPVIYLLDGDAYVQHFFNVSDALSGGGLTPEFILVGVEHKQRIRDLTPTGIESHPGTGGADKFLQFIEQELIPRIDKGYQTNGFQILAGHSFGGLFTLHAMQAKPDLFNAYFAFSPSLYWDKQTTVKSVKALLTSKTQYHNFLYMNMGNEGLDDPYDNSIAMRDGYMDLVTFIEHNAPEKFRFVSKHMEEEYHASTVVIGTFYALRSLYRKYPLPTAIVKQGLTAINQHYQELSEEVGIKINPTLGRLSNAGMYHMWSNGDLSKGIEILNYLVNLNPSSDRVHDGLAQIYKADGQLDKALSHCEMSVRYSGSESANYQTYKAHCKEIRQQAQGSD
ncbi:alpha/beta hydrolase-fold protein [Pseudoalteromonas sp. T1lg48]|uniref:alpha/beta hydrolase-fold protein n=1 Tax=Pseudoalteromonas sp. T1lg48 TaxID=2077100 RepID=UPI000CF692BF|nr:alpha/beta hydrolase-fold protein [Pseudoalteromonas sp. T1lg48]